jgi:hypothetical protein
VKSAITPEALKSAGAFGFLTVPLPVPPTIEEAFRYRRREQYVSLGFGVNGGVMNDFVGDAVRPRSPNLYKSVLLHPAVKPYTDAFQIETAPPNWLEGMSIEEFDSRQEQFQTWSETSRCLLLDRKVRQFFVGTVAEIRTWLTLRSALYRDREPWSRLDRKISSKMAEQKLSTWLGEQTPPLLLGEYIQEWERQFRERQSITACTAAGFRLGFGQDSVRALMTEAFRSPGSGS